MIYLNQNFLILFLLPILFFASTSATNEGVITSSSEKTVIAEKPNDGFSEKIYARGFDNYVKTYKLSYDGESFGYSNWMKRKNVKAKYFAQKNSTQSVYERFEDWKEGKDVVMACSGAFSSQVYGRPQKDWPPVGLTVDNGVVVNKNIEYNSMDGLVIVYATGGVVVTDIEDPRLTITYSNGKSYKINAREDKERLLDWAISEKATIFQTHLLAYDNELNISRAARKEKRMRRTLVLATDSSGDLFHIVYYFKEKVYMYDLGRDLLQYLRDDEDMNVVAILNLDTGMYNVQEVWDEDGYSQSELSGDTNMKDATNLVVYHYED
jgi:hypothetical protein